MPKPPERSAESFNYFNHLIFVFICASFFYSNYFIFIPKLFLKKRVVEYSLIIVFSIIVVLLLLNFFPVVNHNHEMMPMRGRPGFPDNFPDPYPKRFPKRFSFLNPSIVVPFVTWFLSTGIRMTAEWYKSEKQKVVIEKEKLNTELAFLKSQVNPHFIFNVLNNICSLARKKSDETELAIIKLSNLLRYNLYDFKQDKVSLDKEIQYLNDYIDIQKIRLHDNIKIDFTFKGNTENILIEPLLFIPFVENAFKHGVNTIDKGEINILIESNSDSLHFMVKNPIFNKIQQTENQSGIGLNNVLRRLNLLYPDKHKIYITNNENEYIVDLKIILND